MKISEKTFKALANEDRIQMLKMIAKNKELCPNEIEQSFYLEQSTCSHHLNYLKRQGFLKSRREGRKQFYSVNFDTFQEVSDFMKAIIYDQ